MGFREIIPGLGAFQIRPSENDDNGSKELEKFFDDVVSHFLNRASQRERLSDKVHDIHKEKKSGNDILDEPMPEYIGDKKLIPDETFVLVGFYKSPGHLKWIKENKLYNTRTGAGNGSIHLDPTITGAKYLLLHSRNNSKTGLMFTLSDEGPRVFSKNDLEKKKYPYPSQNFYLVFELTGECDNEFRNKKWDVTELEGYKIGNVKSWPFSTSLTKMMKAVANE
jgi:hypothetical protein